MNSAESEFQKGTDYLRRLPRENYQGHAHVHWSLTVNDRTTGWLNFQFRNKFREVLTHSMFRYGICCPVYCLMPDHIHTLWIGLFEGSDQLNAMKFFRKHLNQVFAVHDIRLQQQPYDHVIPQCEPEEFGIEDVTEYIARNPERAQLVGIDEFDRYPFTGCLIPGYPDLNPFQDHYWDLLWSIVSGIRKHGLVRSYS